jgi:hypothetical protein
VGFPLCRYKSRLVFYNDTAQLSFEIFGETSQALASQVLEVIFLLYSIDKNSFML